MLDQLDEKLGDDFPLVGRHREIRPRGRLPRRAEQRTVRHRVDLIPSRRHPPHRNPLPRMLLLTQRSRRQRQQPKKNRTWLRKLRLIAARNSGLEMAGAVLTALGEHAVAALTRHACPQLQAWHPIYQFSFARTASCIAARAAYLCPGNLIHSVRQSARAVNSTSANRPLRSIHSEEAISRLHFAHLSIASVRNRGRLAARCR